MHHVITGWHAARSLPRRSILHGPVLPRTFTEVPLSLSSSFLFSFFVQKSNRLGYQKDTASASRFTRKKIMERKYLNHSCSAIEIHISCVRKEHACAFSSQYLLVQIAIEIPTVSMNFNFEFQYNDFRWHEFR